jgi:hypothetical protein
VIIFGNGSLALALGRAMTFLETYPPSLRGRHRHRHPRTTLLPQPTKPFDLQKSLELYFLNLAIRENTGCIL